MSRTNISELTFAYDGSYDNIFTNASFAFDTDWKLGFCGRNGRGKTTFLKLLMGLYEYRGTITAGVEFEYFPFEVKNQDRSTLEVLTEVTGGKPLWEIERELSKLSLDLEILNRAFANLSGGEKTKTLLCGLFLRENNFLLIDEPTNHLDMIGRSAVAKYLNGKKGYILVSHDRDFLDSCVDHILSINRANIEVQKGNFSSWYYNKNLKDEYEQAENSRLKKEIKRLTVTAREKADWSYKSESRIIGFDPRKVEKSTGRRPYEAAQSKKMMKRSKVIENRQERSIEEKSKLLKNIETADNLKIHPLKYHTNRLIELTDVAIYYGETLIKDSISFSVHQGERISISGSNGAGKTSILKLLTTPTSTPTFTGNLHIGSQLKISYVPQDSSFLSGKLTDFAIEKGIDEALFKAILRKLGFSRVQFDKDMSDYSSGQKKKVLIAASLCEHAHIYIWDEPLNYIDVLSRIQIEELISKYQPTMIFVEHDSAFVRNISTRTV